MSSILENVEDIEFKKNEDLDDNVSPEDIHELFETIFERIQTLVNSSELKERGFTPDGFKSQLIPLVNMAEAIKFLPKASESVKAKVSGTFGTMQQLVKNFEKEIQGQQSEIMKDTAYIKTLTEAFEFINDSILEVVNELNPDCFLALKSLDDLYFCNIKNFMGRLEGFSSPMKSNINNEAQNKSEAMQKSAIAMAEKIEELMRENEELRKAQEQEQNDAKAQISDNGMDFLDLSNRGLFRDKSENKIKALASSKSNLGSTMKSQKSFDKPKSSRSVSPIGERRANPEGIIPLKELKEIIEEVKDEKQRYDTLCDKKKCKYESLKTFMGIYLKNRHKNPRSAKEFGEKFNKSINYYGQSDITVQIFKAIFENVIDEEFFTIAADIRSKLNIHLEAS